MPSPADSISQRCQGVCAKRSVFKDSSGGTPGSSTFTYVRSGTQVVFQNRAAVESWLSGYASSAASLDYDLEAGSTPNRLSNDFYCRVLRRQSTSCGISIVYQLPVTRAHTSRVCRVVGLLCIGTQGRRFASPLFCLLPAPTRCGARPGRSPKLNPTIRKWGLRWRRHTLSC